ncbi:MAG: UDP-glucose 4-epimerase GalE, partial [Gammaproteobacteria bacterium]|nr:UDP-glucose 4-epimerase GalE [Gammaproteobacteria bacterium]
VTGGAGYIGSHVVKLLGEAGHEPVTLDNLSKGNRSAVLYGDLVVGDTGDRALVARLLRDHAIDTVMHFAAFTIVPESVADPLKYYGNNTCNTRNLIACCVEAGVKNFVFSSTAAVYGMPDGGRCSEHTPTSPINPYGMSKLMSEHMLRDTCAAHPLRAVILRYFNVAGSDPDGQIGQSTPGSTLLIKVAVEAAFGKRETLRVFGTDYPTPDGTGVRDYIHVTDLAAAHLDALRYLENGGDSVTLNCGYGHGYSVREVIDTVERLAGKPLPVSEDARRPGDPPLLIAEAERIKSTLGWAPRYDSLDTIVQTSLDWERRLGGQ